MSPRLVSLGPALRAATPGLLTGRGRAASWRLSPRAVSGRGRAARRAASPAGTPSRRSSASASWSTVVSVTRSGCRWHIRNSPSMPPVAALSAISASATVNRPVACPASMSRRARGARPMGMSRTSRPDADQEPGDVGVGPAQPPGDPRAHGEQLRRVGDAGAGAVDQLPPAFQHLLRGGLEQLLLAVEVVVERPEADVGLLGDLLDAGPVPAALGDQPHRGVDEGLPGPGLTPVQPRHPRRAGCRCRLCHHCSSRRPA